MANNRELAWIATRASDDAFFLGRALAEYKQFHDINDDALAVILECKLEDVLKLDLCRLPDDQSPGFQSDVRRIADFASCNFINLVQILREVASVTSLQTLRGDASTSLLMAARDRGQNETRKQKRKDSKDDPKNK